MGWERYGILGLGVLPFLHQLPGWTYEFRFETEIGLSYYVCAKRLRDGLKR